MVNLDIPVKILTMERIHDPQGLHYVQEIPPGKAVETLDDVVETIVKHMDFPTLKTSREISTRWRKIVTKELQKQVTLTFCFDSPERYENLKKYHKGHVQVDFSPNYENHSSNKNLILMRQKNYPNSAQDPVSSLNALCNLLVKNPEGFPCSSFKIITKFLNTPSINYIFKSIENCLRELDLVLFYFAKEGTFEESHVMEELEELLLNSLPKLEHLRLHSTLPARWQQEILDYDLNPSKQFLRNKDITKEGEENLKLPLLKTTYLDGLLPSKFLQGIQKAARNVGKVEDCSSTSMCRIPLNPFLMQILDHLALNTYQRPGKPNRVVVLNLNFNNLAYVYRPKIIPLVNQILEKNASVLEKVTFDSAQLFPHIKIPSMKRLKNLELVGSELPTRTIHLHLRKHPELKAFGDAFSDDDDDDEFWGYVRTECSLEVKFPALQNISVEQDFNFVENFGRFLGLRCYGPFPSVKLFVTLSPFARTALDRESIEMAKLFPQACIREYKNRRSVRFGRQEFVWGSERSVSFLNQPSYSYYFGIGSVEND